MQFRSCVMWGCLGLAGCIYSQPAPPENALPIRVRNTHMASSGPDARYANLAMGQRSGSSGTLANTDENANVGGESPDAKSRHGGLKWGGASSALEVMRATGGYSPSAASESAREQPSEVQDIFAPSDHYYVDGVDLGPTLDREPGTGGREGHRMAQKSSPKD